MTDLPPASSDDEIVSAVLDGAATDDERNRVEGDVALTARLEELRRVRDQVAEPVRPLDELTAKRMLSGALDAAERGHAASGAALAADARARRRSPRRDATLATWLSAVAAVALVALVAVPLIGSLGGGDDDEAATGVADSGDDSTAGGAESGGEEAADGDFARTDAGELEAEGDESDSSSAGSDGSADSTDRLPADIGEFESVEAFAAAAPLESLATPETSSAPPTRSVLPGCDLEPSGATLETIAAGTVEGRAVVAEVWRSGDERVVRVVERSSCEVLLVSESR